MAASNYLTPQVPVGGPTPVVSPGTSTTIRNTQALPAVNEDVFFKVGMGAEETTTAAQFKLGISTTDAAAEGTFAVQVHGYAQVGGPGVLLTTVLTGDVQVTALNTGSLFISEAISAGWPLMSFRVTVLGGYGATDPFKFYAHFGNE